MGSPTKEEWAEGHKLAKKIGFEIPEFSSSQTPAERLFKFLPEISEDASRLMARMLTFNPEERISAFDILNHKFMKPSDPTVVIDLEFITEKADSDTEDSPNDIGSESKYLNNQRSDLNLALLSEKSSAVNPSNMSLPPLHSTLNTPARVRSPMRSPKVKLFSDSSRNSNFATLPPLKTAVLNIEHLKTRNYRHGMNNPVLILWGITQNSDSCASNLEN